MSDFDTVLERLLSDPVFATALAADPAGALGGYRLTPEEVALLNSQVTGDVGGQAAVETRANQSSVFGMLAPLSGFGGAVVEAFGPGTQAGPATPAVPGGPAAPGAPMQQGFGAAPGGQGGGAGFGPAAPYEHGFGSVGASQGFGAAAYQDGFGPSAAPQPAGGLAGLGDELDRGIAEARGADPAPPEGYATRVDADGDGSWDRHTLRGTGAGGVDILVDTDADGRADFVGHDADADGRVNSARFDADGDGFFEKRSYDDDGDGWLDRTETNRPPADPPAGGLVGRNLRFPDRE